MQAIVGFVSSHNLGIRPRGATIRSAVGGAHLTSSFIIVPPPHSHYYDAQGTVEGASGIELLLRISISSTDSDSSLSIQHAIVCQRQCEASRTGQHRMIHDHARFCQGRLRSTIETKHRKLHCVDSTVRAYASSGPQRCILRLTEIVHRSERPDLSSSYGLSIHRSDIATCAMSVPQCIVMCVCVYRE